MQTLQLLQWQGNLLANECNKKTLLKIHAYVYINVYNMY